MEIRSFWLKIAVQGLAVFGFAVLLSFGAWGIQKIIRYQRGQPATSSSPAAAVIPETAKSTTPQPNHATPPKSPPPPSTVKLIPGPATVREYELPVPGPRILPNGVPDLSIQIVSIGVISDATGEFSVATSVPPTGQTGIVFDVANVGTAVSERWYFTANLPVLGGLFASEPQPPLAPGERIRFTIGFRNLLNRGENRAVFTVDPQNALRDANRANDSATAVIIRGD